MAEYIEREALLERIDGIWDCADMVFEPNDKCCRSDDCASCKWRETKNAIRKIAANIPAADVRPVIRGHIEEDENTYLYCSECNCNITLAAYETPNGNLILRPNFCPNCGADMREEQT